MRRGLPQQAASHGPAGSGPAPDPSAPAAGASTSPAAPKWTEQVVLSVHRWTDALLSFRISRDAAFRFTPGHYARLGLTAADGTLVWRPFSMVSAAEAPELEFIATLVPDGEFSTLLARIEPGDPILVDKASFGFLTADRVAPGRDLWMLASGTGLGPFISMLRGPDVWRGFQTLTVVHSVRYAHDLAYRSELEALVHASASGAHAPTDATPDAASIAALRYVPVVTRETVPGALGQRIPQLIESEQLQQTVGLPLDPQLSRVLVCGNPDMNAELRRLLTAHGFRTPRRGLAGQMAFENYW